MTLSTPIELAALAEVARGLALTADSWTDRLECDYDKRTGLHIMETDEYDVWLLRWPPGTSVTPHDHGESAVAFAVVDGQLREVRWGAAGPRSRLVEAGQVATLPSGIVHDVAAEGEPALSVHVYSPPLTTMSFYDESGQKVLSQSPIDDGPTDAAGTRVLQPAAH